ncbi:GNAT family N-acetyltransferase [Pseudoalteromonas piscicida]|uniref:GNAT family N-acetyltransferase n=1 Tax=Pseudoalteromonas piscicida TaxID=43662 RepID=A0A2A5JL86_PSEO7|nr:GNAT family N-acetyltransferase [Pseudoalteromonas piscicida]PCK30109.1 GNAT family N-acetyltransferase [Pseudoalteromonas piscicida]
MTEYTHQFINSITAINEKQWHSIAPAHVFTSYAWLAALELSGCTTKETGWAPHHLVIAAQGDPVAIIPGYVKSHSYGEYVFDWAFAEAYERHGLDYYPKWLCGVPFTPTQGPRILTKAVSNGLLQYIEATITDLAQHGISGVHINFCTEAESEYLAQSQLVQRRNVQFHWHNKGYTQFDDFLATLTSRKRKMILKERQAVNRQAFEIKWINGSEISAAQLDAFFLCYRLTYLKRSRHQGYLSHAFFQQVVTTMPHALRLCCAYVDDEVIATSLYLVDGDTLYGRYWGAIDDSYDFLHFELCYYQGIEYAIANQLAVFDAGAQGEHKLVRGFEPVWRQSYHRLFHPDFQRALEDFTQREGDALEHYFAECNTKLPFKHQ